MIRLIRRKLDYHILPRELVRYIVLVSASGPLVVIALIMSVPFDVVGTDWLTAVILAVLALIAERNPLHLTHKTNVNLASVAYVSMFLLLPPSLCAALVLAASLGAQLLKMAADPELALAEPLFNIGQTSLYVSLAAIAAIMVDRASINQMVGDIDIVTCLVVSVVMHIGNTALVSVAAGRHLGTSVVRIWMQNLSIDWVPHLAMTLMGVCAAALGHETPILIPALVVPALLIHRAVGQSVELRENVYQALASMVDIVELRDPYTAGHSRRVAETARLLAIDLGLTNEEADVIHSAGIVHDIGKVALDPAILGKPGKLNDSEWSEMKLHPVLGAEVVGQFESYRHGVSLVRSHHEAWDGSGYPDGLEGDAIPLGARILAVADTFDALTSDRPYRSGMNVERALEILRGGMDQQWERRVVESLISLVQADNGAVPVFKRDLEEVIRQTGGNTLRSSDSSTTAA